MADEPEQSDVHSGGVAVDPTATVEDLKAALDAEGIEYKSTDRKADLIARLEGREVEGDATREDSSQVQTDPSTTVPGGRYINTSGQVVNAFGERIE